MAEFHLTGIGRAFFEGTLPNVASSLEAIAQELRQANELRRQAQTRQPVDTPSALVATGEASPDKQPFNDIQRLAVLGYDNGVFWGRVESLYDAAKWNSPLLPLILEQLKDCTGSGGRSIALEKINNMRAALSEVWDLIQYSDGSVPSWDEVVEGLELPTSHA